MDTLVAVAAMKGEYIQRLAFDVFGRRIDAERTSGWWAAYFAGNDGKHRPADLSIPTDLEAHEIASFVDDPFHESASEQHPIVRLL